MKFNYGLESAKTKYSFYPIPDNTASVKYERKLGEMQTVEIRK